MIRGSGLRGGGLREDEDVQPMQYVANLTDVMLVLACGLMAAVITFWQVDLKQTNIDRDKMQRIEASDVIQQESGSVSTDGLVNQGMVYKDPETGTLYIFEN